MKSKFFRKKASIKGSYALNVTPLIDVMLVLMVIFMIASTSVVRYEHIQLPGGHKGKGVSSQGEKALSLMVHSDGSVSVGDVRYGDDQWMDCLRKSSSWKIYGHTHVSYGVIADILKRMKENGVQHIQLAFTS